MGLPAAPSTGRHIFVFSIAARPPPIVQTHPALREGSPGSGPQGSLLAPLLGPAPSLLGAAASGKFSAAPWRERPGWRGAPQAPLSRKRTLGLWDPRTTEWWSALPASPDPGFPGSASWAQKQPGALPTLFPSVNEGPGERDGRGQDCPAVQEASLGTRRCLATTRSRGCAALQVLPTPLNYPLSTRCVCFPGGSDGEESAFSAEGLGLIPGAHPVLLPGESHGQRSLEGYSPPDRKESDTTERLSTHIGTHTTCISCHQKETLGRAPWGCPRPPSLSASSVCQEPVSSPPEFPALGGPLGGTGEGAGRAEAGGPDKPLTTLSARWTSRGLGPCRRVSRQLTGSCRWDWPGWAGGHPGWGIPGAPSPVPAPDEGQRVGGGPCPQVLAGRMMWGRLAQG